MLSQEKAGRLYFHICFVKYARNRRDPGVRGHVNPRLDMSRQAMVLLIHVNQANCYLAAPGFSFSIDLLSEHFLF